MKNSFIVAFTCYISSFSSHHHHCNNRVAFGPGFWYIMSKKSEERERERGMNESCKRKITFNPIIETSLLLIHQIKDSLSLSLSLLLLKDPSLVYMRIMSYRHYVWYKSICYKNRMKRWNGYNYEWRRSVATNDPFGLEWWWCPLNWMLIILHLLLMMIFHHWNHIHSSSCISLMMSSLILFSLHLTWVSSSSSGVHPSSPGFIVWNMLEDDSLCDGMMHQTHQSVVQEWKIIFILIILIVRCEERRTLGASWWLNWLKMMMFFFLFSLHLIRSWWDSFTPFFLTAQMVMRMMETVAVASDVMMIILFFVFILRIQTGVTGVNYIIIGDDDQEQQEHPHHDWSKNSWCGRCWWWVWKENFFWLN